MEVRYIFLHPSDTNEILFSTPLIRAVMKSVEHAEVISAVPEGCQWLLESNPFVWSLLVYDKNPSNSIRQFRETGADYLVDLTGGRQTRWFKNRLRVMDFTLPYKSLNRIRQITDKMEAADQYRQEGIKLLSVFDLKDEGPELDYFYGRNKQFIEHALPESFLKGYAVLDMPATPADGLRLAAPVSQLISRIEQPLVLCGSEHWRPAGEEIMRRTGCTILSTCGDFSDQEQVFIRAGAKVLINIESGWEIWPMVLKKPHFMVDIEKEPAEWKEQVKSIRDVLKGNN